jgi:hypothetical protein
MSFKFARDVSITNTVKHVAEKLTVKHASEKLILMPPDEPSMLDGNCLMKRRISLASYVRGSSGRMTEIFAPHLPARDVLREILRLRLMWCIGMPSP